MQRREQLKMELHELIQGVYIEHIPSLEISPPPEVLPTADRDSIIAVDGSDNTVSQGIMKRT